MQNIKQFLAQLSHHPGVYQMLGENNEILYVGKAKDLKKRVASYFNSRVKDPKTTSLVAKIKHIDVTVTTSEMEAVLLECNLIKTHKPRYNILLRDDKSYPYIFISDQHAFPRIDLYRGQRKKNGLYFGPYPNATAAREAINLLQKVFRIRTCVDSYFENRTRPCLLYQIGRCTGPCVNLISQEEYNQNVKLAVLFLEGKSNQVIDALQAKMEIAANALQFEMAAELRDQINRLRQIQHKQYVNVGEGNADILGVAVENNVVALQLLSIRQGQVLGSRAYFPVVPLGSTTEEIIVAFIKQHYLHDAIHIETIPRQIILNMSIAEREVLEKVFAAQSQHKVEILSNVRGDKKKWIQMANTSAKQSLMTHLFTKANVKERAQVIQRLFELDDIPQRLECFDISHSMGEATVASCVVFDINGPVKSAYRRFNIHNITPGDDVAAMRQVIMRRFKRFQADNAAQLPDIVFIDGGPTQLSAAKEVIDELTISSIMLVGISKGQDRKPGFETLHFTERPPQHLPADSIALHFIQQIRDEAHRFAITGHRQRRDKARRHSSLELIPGIGAKRRRDLLRYFGGIQGIAHASLEELTKVPGISHSLAERIFAALHDTTI